MPAVVTSVLQMINWRLMCLLYLMSCCNSCSNERAVAREMCCLLHICFKRPKHGMAKGPLQTEETHEISEGSRQDGAWLEKKATAQPRAVAWMYHFAMGTAQPTAVTQL